MLFGKVRYHWFSAKTQSQAHPRFHFGQTSLAEYIIQHVRLTL